ncbi:amino acid adenylation domain-containing protein [Streptomyces sp. NPDC048290]|uniref:amino acid adenylation domain-containing protein n=1 Tax=Streptomyces sp. NPDC048290 TaxID=3155811 RepID=UPI0034334865
MSSSSRTEITSVQPLSPAQAGMLFHRLLDGSDTVYLNQDHYRLTGSLDTTVFRAAWQRVTDRHDALRTTLVWKDLDEPLQVVRARVTVPWEELDLRGLGEEEQQARLAELAERQRRAGLPEDAEAPFALTLIALADDRQELLWTSRHIVLDGWSAAVVLREVLACYREAMGGPLAALPAPVPQARYLSWLNDLNSTPAQEYWRARLAGCETPTTIPLPSPSPTSADGAPLRVPFNLNRETSDQLRACARAHRLTLASMLEGAWALTLSAFSGEHDVLFGAVRSGRMLDLPEAHEIVGMLVNTVPVRAAVDPATPVAGWLAALHRELLDQRPYEHASLTDIQDWSDIARPKLMFESIVTVQTIPELRAHELPPGLKVEHLANLVDSGYQTALVITPSDTVTGELVCRTDAVDRGTAQALVTLFARLLEQTGQNPRTPIGALNLISRAEQTLLDEALGAPAPHTKPRPLLDLIADQVQWRPHAPAVMWGEKDQLTYQELDILASAWATELVARGAGPDRTVGICFPRSPELVVAMVAVLRAGAAYVPIDPGHPRQRRVDMLADTGTRLLLAAPEYLSRLRGHEGIATLPLTLSTRLEPHPEVELPPVHPESLAYIVYTSGSTGTPKGVSVQHRALEWFVSTADYLDLAPGNVMGMASSPSFDALTFEVWTALAHGASLRVIPHDVLLDPATLRDCLLDWRVDVMYLTAALVEELARYAPDFARGLRVLLFGGQASDPLVVARVKALSAPSRLLQVYGPTETTVWSSVQRVGDDSEDFVPLGRPLPRTTEYLLDADLRPVPPGVPGELYIGGEGVVRGYHGKPARTAECFLPDPFRAGRMYRTGDLARLHHDGRLEFLGRADDQVKIRGFRVEPGEIAAVLREHRDVDAAVVGVRHDPQRGTLLVAHVVSTATPEELRAFAAAQLPAYMVPTHYVALDRLPLSVTGKVDRTRLPAPELADAGPESAGAPPTALEQSIAAVWARFLGLPEVGVTQDFFHLGGHSLLAVRVVVALARELGIEITVRQLFDARTVRRLAEIACAGTAPVHEAIPRTPHGVPVPLSSGQRRLWMLQEMNPGTASYNSPVWLRQHGTLDIDALRGAVSDVVRRHEALRMRIEMTEDGPVQLAAPATEVPVTVHDLTGLPVAERESCARELLTAEAAREFDLAHDTLLRCSVVRLNADEHLLLLTFHHIAYDVTSEAVIAADLSARYQAGLSGAAEAVAPPSCSASDYAAWEHRRRVEGHYSAGLAYWREKLRDLPTLELPADRRRLATRSSTSHSHSHSHAFGFTAEQYETLTELGRQHGATPFMTFLALFGVLMRRHTGQDDLPIGSPMDLRDHPDLEGLVGFLVNTVVLRLDLAGAETFADLLGRVQDTTLEAHAHRNVPFDLVVEDVNPARHADRSPLFDVLFQLSADASPAWDFPGLSTRLEPHAVLAGNFDIEVELTPRPDGGLAGQILCNADLFDEVTVRLLADRFVLLAERVCAAPTSPLGELGVLVAADRRAIASLADASSTEPTPPGDAPVRLDESVARWARRNLTGPAVVCGETTLGYQDLDRRCGELAARLRDRGVGRGSVVGLWAEPRPETIVAILAILRAGAAYLPLEPSDPAERVWGMVRDQKCAALLTTQDVHRVPEDFRHLAIGLHPESGHVPPLQALPVADGEERDLAYVIHTSGSTGRPKAVGVEHRSVSHYAVVTAREYGLTPDDRVLQFSSFSFDAFVSELWTTLAAGATLLLSKTRVLSPADLHTALATTRTTVIDVPTAFWHQWSAWLAEEPEAKIPGDLRLVIIGGEQANASHLAQWHAAVGGGVRLINSYGPTEATSVVTHADLTDPADRRDDEREVTIGRPLPGTHAYVLDDALRPVPPGVAGELYMAGVQLARGYLQAPAFTAQSFLPDPWGPPGARMYRTGDIARLNSRGLLELLGRVDSQVKVRGFRIELSEVERALAAFPGVCSAAAAVHTHEESGRLLVGYLVLAGDLQPDSAAVLAFLRERLPQHCVPAAVVILNELPLTRSGKVDRKALPAPGDEPVHRRPLPELTAAQKVLAEIWLSVLPVTSVGPSDRFFDVGGHSLALARVGARIRAELGLDVPLPLFYERPTLAEQAAVIEALIEEEIAAMTDAEVQEALGGGSARGA